MGTCTSKQKEDTYNLISNINIDKYLFKYKVKITQNFLQFKKNDSLYIYLCEDDLKLHNTNFTCSILYTDIINWSNYGFYYWTFSILSNNLKQKFIIFLVDDSRIISKNIYDLKNKNKNKKSEYIYD